MSITIGLNQSKQVKLPVIKKGGYAQNTTFTVSGVPFGMSYNFSPASTSDGSSFDVIFTMTTNQFVAEGTYNLVFSGVPAPKFTQSVLVSVVVPTTTTTTTKPPTTTTTRPPTLPPTSSTTTTTTKPPRIYRELYVYRIIRGTTLNAIDRAIAGDPYPFHGFSYQVGTSNYRIFNLSTSGESHRSYFEFEKLTGVPPYYKVTEADLILPITAFKPLFAFSDDAQGRSQLANMANQINSPGDIFYTIVNDKYGTPSMFQNGPNTYSESRAGNLPFLNGSPLSNGAVPGTFTMPFVVPQLTNFADGIMLSINIGPTYGGLSTNQYRSLVGLPFVTSENSIDVNATATKIRIALDPI